MTFALGAAAVAAKDRTAVSAFGAELQLATLILTFGLVLWGAFYFVDQVWYHRLLVGAVKHGQHIEAKIRQFLPGEGLTSTISQASPYAFKMVKKERMIHSRAKLRIFYLIGAGVLILAGSALQFSGAVT